MIDDDDLESRMREQWGVSPPDTSPEGKAIARAHERPLPKKVLVERVESRFLEDEPTFFFYADRPGQQPEKMFFVRGVEHARREAERLIAAGVVLAEMRLTEL